TSLFALSARQSPRAALFPYTTLFRSALAPSGVVLVVDSEGNELVAQKTDEPFVPASVTKIVTAWLERRAHQFSGPPTRSLRSPRSEEHTSELPSLTNLACRLLLETNT